MSLGDGSQHQHPNSGNFKSNFGNGMNNTGANSHINQLPQYGSTGQLGHGQFHQNYMDPSSTNHGFGNGQGSSHPSSSPQMMGNQSNLNMMSHHHQNTMGQFQQMNHTGQHNYFMPQNSQYGNWRQESVAIVLALWGQSPNNLYNKFTTINMTWQHPPLYI